FAMRTAAAPTLATLASALASERKVSAVQRLVSGLTLTLLLATPSRAGWVSHGPEGGTVTALAVDSASPSTVYAGTFGGGVFKTTNGGGSWSAVNSGLPSNEIIIGALAVDAKTSPSTVYAGTDGGGVSTTEGRGGIKRREGGGRGRAENTGLDAAAEAAATAEDAGTGARMVA